MPLPLIALFIAAFAFGTTEFVIAGVLPQVAEGLDVSIPIAGYLVSGYAIGIAIGGPLMTIATSGVARRTLLVSLTLIFTAGQAACALAPDFGSMLGLRVAVAIAHGVFFGVAMVVAVRLVPEDKRGRAVAFVLAGLTVSNIIGVPAGAAIGNAFGWRATFWAMFALGIVSVGVMLALLPNARGEASRPQALAREIRVLGRQQVWTSLLVMLMLMIGQFVPYTYISPLLTEVTGLDRSDVPWVLLLVGVGCTVGVFIGGRLADWHLMPSLIALTLFQSLVLAAIWFFAPYPVAMVALLTLWGAVNFTIGTPIQARILSWTADAPNLASSLIPAGFNLGIALAASIGAGLLTAGFSYRSLPVLGIGAMLVAAGVVIASWTAERRSGAIPPQPAGA
ncbi:MAG: MFS transporter [Rhizobiaceae bacterium]